jgi:hypothetical protein
VRIPPIKFIRRVYEAPRACKFVKELLIFWSGDPGGTEEKQWEVPLWR